ncbi:MAG TPA: GatB/YqeY domain-containing protein [Anaerolineales bacterium]|nr:GatB/YqeY domain-containing protein [Anaerolineales bacterium]
MKIMTDKGVLENALKQAMRSRDDLRKRTLRMVLSAIRLAEIEKGTALEAPAIPAILQKEIKSRRESIVDAERARRPELAAEAQAEIAVLESFLPQQMSAFEVEELARAAIAEVGAASPREMGQVMKVLMPKIQGRADGAQVSQIVRWLLK